MLLDAKELVVLRHAVGAAHRARLDLAGIEAHGDVGNGAVFRFARAVRDDGRVGGGLRHVDGFEGFGERADLIHLDENRVGDAAVDAFAQDLRVRDEEVVADELNLIAERGGELRPPFPVAFSHAVFDRDDRIAAAPVGENADPVVGRERAVSAADADLR